MGLWGAGRAFSDRSFLKILIFSTIYGRFRGAQANLPHPPRDRVKVLYFLDLSKRVAELSAYCKLSSNSRSLLSKYLEKLCSKEQTLIHKLKV